MTHEKVICKHCNGDITIRNPTGYCDHLYYPENCVICEIIREVGDLKNFDLQSNHDDLIDEIIDIIKKHRR